jgi:hypothetical protein
VGGEEGLSVLVEVFLREGEREKRKEEHWKKLAEIGVREIDISYIIYI